MACPTVVIFIAQLNHAASFANIAVGVIVGPHRVAVDDPRNKVFLFPAGIAIYYDYARRGFIFGDLFGLSTRRLMVHDADYVSVALFRNWPALLETSR